MIGVLLLLLGGCATASEPPAPPQPPSVPVSTDPARTAYDTWLAEHGGNAAQVTTGTPLGHATSAYTFFYVSAAPGHKTHAAAVSESGDIVAPLQYGSRPVPPSTPGAWLTFLGATSPAEAHAQVAFLNGSWATVAPGTPTAEMVAREAPDAADTITAPTIEGDDTGRTFDAWFFQPPDMTPFHVVIRATPDGDEKTVTYP